ncbi:hypothetical protein C8Q76DRAFT_633024 [Earliella scabrosa]|nr:hypothetical protein C8Q76DRAFT_633024 [Earliella scabrosa]
MELRRGDSRGSYIWGRSVHNTRIEWLWVDVTGGFGGKWKVFFLDLEHSYGLDADCPSHIWLLHHLLLDGINEDAQEWAATWNAHRLQIRGERPASPREMFMFGMVTHGPRGLADVLDEPVDDLANYGVDWASMQDANVMRHHLANNPHIELTPHPSTSPSVPQHLANVTCDAPRCPFTVAQVSALNRHLARHHDIGNRDMFARRQLWVTALQYCTPLF